MAPTREKQLRAGVFAGRQTVIVSLSDVSAGPPLGRDEFKKFSVRSHPVGKCYCQMPLPVRKFHS